MMDVSVIIVNWNTCKLLEDCLLSLQASTGDFSMEIIVVDNNSSDDSVKMLETKFHEVKLIVNQQNLGFAAANNKGIRKSKGRYVLLLNSDTVVFEDTLAKTIEYGDANPDAAAIGCRVMLNNKQPQMTCFNFPDLLSVFFGASGLERMFRKNRIFGRERMWWWNRDTFRQVDVISGMYMLVRRQAIAEIGLMDEDYFFYYEETDWCYRFAKNGWKLLFTPETSIIHVGGGGQSSAKAAVKMFVQQQKSCLIFFKKHKGPFKTLIARILLTTGFAGRLIVWSIMDTCNRIRSRETQILNRLKAKAAVIYLLFGIEP